MTRPWPTCALAAATVIIAHLAGAARADTYVWSNPAGGDFAAPEHWSPAGPPGEDDAALFDLDATYVVSFSQNHANSHLFARHGEVTLNLYDGQTSHTYTLQEPAQPVIPLSSMLIVGSEAGDHAALILQGGTVDVSSAYIGSASGSVGAVTVGPLALLNVRGELTAGLAGAGTLTVQQGGTLTSAWTNIGERAGAEGHVTVTGLGSTWTHSGYVNIGGSHALPGGVGTLSILDSGMVNSQHASIGKMGDAEGTAIVSGEGSTWNISRNILIGYDAKATLTVMDQGSLTSELGAIGVHTYSTGTAIVTGAGSTWHMEESLHVGSSGTATLMVLAGGIVTSRTSTMAFADSSTAVTVISGDGSKWTSTESLHVGGTDSQSGGTALLSVTDGAVVEAGQTLHIWETGTLRGDGIVTAQQLLNAGLIAPGLEADDEDGPLFGTLTVEGDYVQDATTGRLRVRLAGNPLNDRLHDRLHVDGDVSLAGLLEIVLHEDFIPVVGQTFQVLSWTGSRTGEFHQIAADEPGGGRYWDFEHLYTAGTITLLPEPTSLALLMLGMLPLCRRRWTF